MKTMLISLFAFIFCWSLAAEEISFAEIATGDDWQAALQKAKEQNSMIFVDVYATWCGPCKAMDAEVYSDDAVGAFYNTTFLNVKMDGETAFGETFMVDYEIDAYPTFVFFDSQGKVINTSSGYMEAAAFVALGKETLGAVRKRAEWANRYRERELSIEEIAEYAEFLARLRQKDKAQKVVLDHLAAQKTEALLPYQPWTLLKTYALEIGNPLLQKVIAEEETFVYWRGADEIRLYYDEVLQYNLKRAATGAEGPDVGVLERTLDILLPVMYSADQEKEAAGRALSSRQSFYLMSEDPGSYIRVTDAYIDQYAAEDTDFLLQATQEALMMEIPELYGAAEAWAGRAYERADSFDAAMYYAYALSMNDKAEAALEFLEKMEERFREEEPEYLQSIEDLKRFVQDKQED